jgi:hypothetical protein
MHGGEPPALESILITTTATRASPNRTTGTGIKWPRPIQRGMGPVSWASSNTEEDLPEVGVTLRSS